MKLLENFSNLYASEDFFYLVCNARELDHQEELLMNYYYRPILGNNAISVYRMLSAEASLLKRFSTPHATKNRLLLLLGFDSKTLTLALEKLQQFKLINFQKSEKSRLSFFLFKILPPLSAKKLFNDSEWFKKLQFAIKDDELFQEIYDFFAQSNIFSYFSSQKKLTIIKKDLNLPFKKLFPQYSWSKSELDFVIALQKKHDISIKSFEILLRYVFIKNGTFKSGLNYLETIVIDLVRQELLSSPKKILIHFNKITNSLVKFSDQTTANTTNESTSKKKFSMIFN